MTYAAIQTQHVNGISNSRDFLALSIPQRRRILNHKQECRGIHAMVTKKAAEYGAENVKADPNSFIQWIMEALAGVVLPVIGPIIVSILARIIVQWITDQFLNKSSDGEPVNEMLNRLAMEAGAA